MNIILIKTEWPPEIEGIFNMYRVMVFFWILAGLTWLGGVVSMLTDLLNLSVSYQFDFTYLANNLSFPIIFQRILPRRQRTGSKFLKSTFTSLSLKKLFDINYTPLTEPNKK